MAIQYTEYPIRTSTGTAIAKTAIDPNNPSNSPSIVDRNNNILFQWNSTNKKWEPLESYQDTLPSNGGFSTTETYGSLLNQNQNVFTNNTTRVINKLPENQKTSILNSNSYQPYNTWVSRSQSTSQQTGTSAQPPAAGAPPAAPEAPDLSQVTSTLEAFGSYTTEQTGTGGLRYPKDMKDDQDRITFQAVEISSRSGQSNSDGFEFRFGTPVYTPVGGPVSIAIQGPISDQSSVDWGPDTVNAIDAALYKTSIGAMGGGEESVSNAVKDFFGKLYGTMSAEQDRIRRYLAGQAANINNVLARTDGVVLNPNMELLFSGPQLRPFNFQFKMSARYDKEGAEIKKIINYFKYNMAPKVEDSGLFIKAPNVFKIDYYKGSQLHPGINKISGGLESKACALTNFSVDYAPLGSYMTYTDGTMVAYLLTLQFQEITPIYNSDNKDYKNSTTIGF